MNNKPEQTSIDSNVQPVEEAGRRTEQKSEDSEVRQLKSGMSEMEARLWNRKMRRAYKFHRADDRGKT